MDVGVFYVKLMGLLNGFYFNGKTFNLTSTKINYVLCIVFRISMRYVTNTAYIHCVCTDIDMVLAST